MKNTCTKDLTTQTTYAIVSGREERSMKKVNKVHLSIRLEPALLTRLVRQADREGLSASAAARLAVRHYVEGNAGYNRRGAR